ncbi:uncharacterized protein LOC8282145 [Ricinus communis]|uniref:uncharacterized protein LOC8282145 n=1 Tax=Ricinus communis TaxID=3988 RepID=UPI00201A65F6|nr:uncharacterized protein LOC8282145 [Ricinus communis]
MKDLSFFFLKNSFGGKMKKGIRNFCNGDGSTSTLNQHHLKPCNDPIHVDDDDMASVDSQRKQPTLEEMILQLELEEEISRKSKLNELVAMRGRRMSCVNNSDILRSARNALNQYPRFSLDGKDAMYRSSFRNLDHHQVAGRKSVCCCDGRGVLMRERNDGFLDRRNSCLPTSLRGENVVWCKPGVIGKLMGLDAMPVPVHNRKETISPIIKRQSLRRRVERHEMERRDMKEICNRGMMRRMPYSSSSSSSSSYRKTPGGGYCVMKPVSIEPLTINDGGWPTRRFPSRNQP